MPAPGKRKMPRMKQGFITSSVLVPHDSTAWPFLPLLSAVSPPPECCFRCEELHHPAVMPMLTCLCKLTRSPYVDRKSDATLAPSFLVGWAGHGRRPAGRLGLAAA